MTKKLKDWQLRKLKQIQAYVDNGVWSFSEFEKERQMEEADMHE